MKTNKNDGFEESDRDAGKVPDGRPYEVGRGKPPMASRFKPGQSGNPKGRRKGSRNLKTYLREELETKVTIKKDGRERTMPKVQLIALQLVNTALKGEPKSIEFLLKLVDLMSPAEPEGEAPELMSDQERKRVLRHLSSIGVAMPDDSTGEGK